MRIFSGNLSSSLPALLTRVGEIIELGVNPEEIPIQLHNGDLPLRGIP